MIYPSVPYVSTPRTFLRHGVTLTWDHKQDTANEPTRLGRWATEAKAHLQKYRPKMAKRVQQDEKLDVSAREARTGRGTKSDWRAHRFSCARLKAVNGARTDPH